MDLESLTDEQRQALSQLRDLTNGADDEVSVGVLESVDWDVASAADLIFGGGALPSKPKQKSPIEQFEVDDSEQSTSEQHRLISPRRQRHHPTPAHAPSPPGALGTAGSVVLAAITIPLHILGNILRFVFNVLHIPFPRGTGLYMPRFRFSWNNFSFGNLFFGPRTATDGSVERWVRELEEETGAVCVGRRHVEVQAATSSADAGSSLSSTLTGRAGARPSTADIDFATGKYLPDFTMGTYEEMLRLCDREARIGCIVLVSAEHDDVPAFKRDTLTDPKLVKLFYDNDIVLWGGDVRDREAWSASEKLQATTYPFVAFVAIQTRRNPNATAPSSSNSVSTTKPTLTILSRHQGPSIDSGPTCADKLSNHLTSQLLPRVLPFLVRIRAEREQALLNPPPARRLQRDAALDRDRSIRAAQDAAFAESARRDRERLAESARLEREKLAAAEQARVEAEMAARQEEDRAKKAQELVEQRQKWRVWIRKYVIGQEPQHGQGAIRIAVRMPNGDRKIRSFDQGCSMTELYAFVDAELGVSSLSSGNGEENPFTNSAYTPVEILEREISKASLNGQNWWGFKLVLAYPRKDILWDTTSTVGGVDGLKGGGQIVVEMLSPISASTTEKEDEYLSESDEE